MRYREEGKGLGKSSSLLSRFASFLAPKKGDPNSARGGKALHVSDATVPGGFYVPSSHESYPATIIRSFSEKSDRRHECETVETQSNATQVLADFFKNKAGKSLSDVEYEGVLSLMRKSRSVESSPTPAYEQSTQSFKLGNKMLRSQHSSREKESFETPSYKPKYDKSLTADSSLQSVNFTGKRRVFDYSSLPSPYRTTIHKYSSAFRSRPRSTNGVQKPQEKTNKTSTTQKISNTAATLISLLDEDTNTTLNNLANPYSPLVSEIKRHRRTPNILPGNESQNQSIGSTPVKSFALSSVENSENTDITNESENKGHLFDKYRPTKSSSLRQSHSIDSEKFKNTEQSSAETKNLSVPTSSFNFQFKKPVAQTKISKSPSQPTSSFKGKIFVKDDIDQNEDIERKPDLEEHEEAFNENEGLNERTFPASLPKSHMVDSYQNSSLKGLKSSFTFETPLSVSEDSAPINQEQVAKCRSLFIF